MKKRWKVEVVFETEREITFAERGELASAMAAQLESLDDGEIARDSVATVASVSCINQTPEEAYITRIVDDFKTYISDVMLDEHHLNYDDHFDFIKAALDVFLALREDAED